MCMAPLKGHVGVLENVLEQSEDKRQQTGKILFVKYGGQGVGPCGTKGFTLLEGPLNLPGSDTGNALAGGSLLQKSSSVSSQC